MGRLIDADALMRNVSLTKTLTPKDALADAIFDVVATLIDSAPTVDPQPQWTSVKDGLPEEHDSIFARYYDTEKWCKSMFRKLSDEVLVVLKFEDGSHMVTTSKTHDGAWFLKSIRRETVTHWMKLPAPPKEDADA